MKALKIGNKIAKYPIIQGGMGVGVSLSSLAGAVAKAGGIGIISTAQIGFQENGFETNPAEVNKKAIVKHIKKAKEIAGGMGLVGVNVMTALKHYREHIRTAAEAGADVIICGAGLPLDLPELVEGTDSKIAPIVSSARAMELILKKWDKKYHRTADFLVVEGPLAGGHLGYHLEQLNNLQDYNFDEEIRGILERKKVYEEKYHKDIPVIVGGGVFSNADVKHILELGADGVQIASRFVATYECDASKAYKDAYIQAKEEDICIIQSPVGMPGRALNNAFVKKMQIEREKITKCYQCLDKCKPAEVPYCITKALIDAVNGDVENGLIFCGANVGRIDKMLSVEELIKELCE